MDSRLPFAFESAKVFDYVNMSLRNDADTADEKDEQKNYNC